MLAIVVFLELVVSSVLVRSQNLTGDQAHYENTPVAGPDSSEEFFLGKYLSDPYISSQKNMRNVYIAQGANPERANVNFTMEFTRLTTPGIKPGTYQYVEEAFVPKESYHFEDFFQIGVRNTTTFEGVNFEVFWDSIDKTLIATTTAPSLCTGMFRNKYVFENSNLVVYYDLPGGIMGERVFIKIN